MPTRPAGPCSYGRCPNLAVARGRCPLHPAPPRTHALSSTQRGYDYRWRQIVARAIREQPWCSRCGRTDRLSGDHIIPLSKGGTDDPSNVRVLCISCNSAKGGR
jgi:5-methylcytosine-specific restriction protein A